MVSLVPSRPKRAARPAARSSTWLCFAGYSTRFVVIGGVMGPLLDERREHSAIQTPAPDAKAFAVCGLRTKGTRPILFAVFSPAQELRDREGVACLATASRPAGRRTGPRAC